VHEFLQAILTAGGPCSCTGRCRRGVPWRPSGGADP